MDFSFRDLGVADVPELAALHVSTFDETHAPRGGGPTLALRLQQWGDAFAAEPRNWFAVGVFDPDGRLVGFSRGQPHVAGVPGYVGELNKLYLLKRCHRRGLGTRLVAETAARFVGRNLDSMLLFGDANSPANAFYEALGAKRLYAPNGEFHGGYGWLDLEALLARCAERAA